MKKFKGVFTALVTPFKNNEVDFPSLGRLVDQQLKNGINGFVINGTTAESPTLELEEVKLIFNFVKKKLGNDKTLIFGAGSNSTEKAKKLAKEAEKLGADAILSVVPYYNKPTQVGLFEHFKAIANSSELPMILYNVPSRTITALELNTIKKLADHPQIIGIKEASGNISFAEQIRQSCGSEFVLLSGDDGSYDEFMNAGGDGIISVGSHIIPEAFIKQQIKQNKKLIDNLYTESNPIPVKMALYFMGTISSPELRLPLTTMSEDKAQKLKEILKERNLI
jgi:4-hydroxy-tetrahydrodipicolinate synthase